MGFHGTLGFRKKSQGFLEILTFDTTYFQLDESLFLVFIKKFTPFDQIAYFLWKIVNKLE